jgi:hypothetical protein
MSLYSTLASVIPTSLIPDSRYLEWQPGVTPLSANGSVALALAFYLAVIFGGQEYMKDRKAMREYSPTCLLCEGGEVETGSELVYPD